MGRFVADHSRLVVSSKTNSDYLLITSLCLTSLYKNSVVVLTRYKLLDISKFGRNSQKSVFNFARNLTILVPYNRNINPRQTGSHYMT